MKTSKLITLTALVASTMTNVFAQQSHTTIEGGISLENFGEVYHLDLNDDHETDFIISLEEDYNPMTDLVSQGIKITPVDDTRGVLLNGTGSTFAAAVPENLPVGLNGIYGANYDQGYWLALTTMKYSGEKAVQYGDWFGKSTYGVGLVLDIDQMDENKTFGWLDIDIDLGGISGKVEGFGYNTQGEAVVNASVGINEINASDLNIFSFGRTIEVQMNDLSLANGTVSVMNITGSLIESTNITGNTTIEINDAAGVYFVRYQKGDFTTTAKVVIR